MPFVAFIFGIVFMHAAMTNEDLQNEENVNVIETDEVKIEITVKDNEGE